MNPVVVAENFQYFVEFFFKKIIIDGPLGKVKYYAIRIECQSTYSFLSVGFECTYIN